MRNEVLANNLGLIIFGVAGTLNLSSELINHPLGVMLSKPLLMPALALILYSGVRPLQRYHTMILAGLTFSWIGDVLLMFVEKGGQAFFIFGLISFLAAHLSYIIAFYGKASESGYLKGRPLLVLPFLIYMVFINLWWWNHLGAMQIPVMLYSIVITIMALSALNLRHIVSKAAWNSLFSGALLFVMSDSLLAINKFVHPIPEAGFLIMSTYILAQYFIVQGSRKI